MILSIIKKSRHKQVLMNLNTLVLRCKSVHVREETQVARLPTMGVWQKVDLELQEDNCTSVA